ncbi:hypothetical protein [Persicitalea jodogahamensis]|uniref:Uncharacterized protein n=1 Tax=Persicitalea jodogahamensis TaxID=402147 RepID=A0A8J3D898_9BACT|nr:hypothetical protein [Persicitalea jodogahamensis]GHB87499.1 hypothetical protein GCM10007390_49250 [Persicitalea jodogahamensis]
MNAAMSERQDDDSILQKVLEQLVEELTDPEIHYVVSGNHYVHQQAERFGEKVYIAQIWLSSDSSWDVVLTDQGLIYDVKLNPNNLDQISRILIPYKEICTITRSGSGVSYPYINDDKRNLMAMFDKKPGN